MKHKRKHTVVHYTNVCSEKKKNTRGSSVLLLRLVFFFSCYELHTQMRLLENFDPIHFSLLSSSDDICDINFVSHDLVLIVLNKGQLLQYQKSGRIVWKTEIPILHVSRVRSQGCATSSATGFYVMTNYGTIYSLCLPYNCSSSPIPTGSAMANRTN